MTIDHGAARQDDRPRAKRAHQGWRYLEDRDAPEDLPEGTDLGDALPGRLIRKLSALGLD